MATGSDPYLTSFYAGTTSVIAADKEGWLVAVTPSGGWIPAVIAGNTGIGLSQRMQSFVLDAVENPFNVVAPGKRPRATLTPSMAMKDGAPWLAFAIQGGDGQDQDSLQFFLNIVEFGMTPQEAAEAPASTATRCANPSTSTTSSRDASC
jgi:gamma-glutamyltranspeptidase/glutathione hydrolase